jgi:Xaa-Pro aminopeptidase
VIIDRIRSRLRGLGLAAYVATSPSTVFYTSGFQSYFLSEWWRWHGSVIVVIPADEASEPALMVSDFEAPHAGHASPIHDVRSFRVWVELRDAAEIAGAALTTADAGRPAQFDGNELEQIIRGILRDRQLTTARLGVDLRSTPVEALRRLERAVPGAEWIDFTDSIYAIRSIKLPFEVERLRRATELSEAGMEFAASQATSGLTAVDFSRLYTIGVLAAARGQERYADYSDQWIIPGVGHAVGIGASSERGGIGLQEGDLIKFDCGVTVDGYRSDGGRTFSFAAPTAQARHLYDVLQAAHDRAVATVEPGTPARVVFQAAQDFIRANGYPSFTRGHYGHSLGIDTFHEEPPYLAANDETYIEAGMVLAVETPAYSADVGPIMIEDLLHLSTHGIERLHKMPRMLRPAGGSG